MQQVQLREYNKESDESFIFNSYLKSYRNSPEAQFLTNTNYFSLYKAKLQQLIDKGTLIVASDTGDPDNIFAWVLYNDFAIHFIYTKYVFRRFGIAKQLFNYAKTTQSSENPTLCSHWTFASQNMSKKLQLEYRPDLKGSL